MAMQQLGLEHQLLGHAARDGRADDAVAGLELRHARADGLDHAGHLPARRERPRRLELVLVLDDEHVGIVDAAGLDGEQNLARARLRVGQILQRKRLGTADAPAQHRLHAVEILPQT